jgi:small subunit ribosomal protein S15
MISKEQKTQIIDNYKSHTGDTGSVGVQVAVLTARIHELTEHLKEHSKDFSTRRGLLRLVGRRRRLLTYLKTSNFKSYADLIQKLGLRK